MMYQLPINADLSNALYAVDAVKYAEAPVPDARRRADLISGLYTLAEILLVMERAKMGMPQIPQEQLDYLWLKEHEYFVRPLDELDRAYETLFEHIGSYLGKHDLMDRINVQKECLKRSVPQWIALELVNAADVFYFDREDKPFAQRMADERRFHELWHVSFLVRTLPFPDDDGVHHRLMPQLVTLATGLTETLEGQLRFDAEPVIVLLREELMHNRQFQRLVNGFLENTYSLVIDMAAWSQSQSEGTPDVAPPMIPGSSRLR